MEETSARTERGPGEVPRRPNASVPFLHRLSTRLVGVLLLLTLVALVALWMTERRMQRELLDGLERSTAVLGEALEASTLEAMVAAQPDHAYDILRRVGELDGVDRVRVIDKRGRIAFSSDAAERGTLLGKEAASCAPCHAGRTQPLSRAPEDGRGRVEDAPEGRRLVMLTPIHNHRSCATAACHVHPPGRQVLGLLELEVSAERLDAGVLSYRRGFVALLAGGILVLAGLLYLFAHSEILDPVAALLEGTRRVARDELEVEIRVHSKGELGQLAGSFNEMICSVRRLEDELNGLLASLEAQVESRTAELTAAQEQLVRTEKLSSLGKLSASIAHEINNPLAGILTFAKLVSRTLAEGPPDDQGRAVLQKNLALVEREAQRCSAIVKNLLDFARERPISRKSVDANAAVDEALSLVANQLAIQGITLERELAALPPVLADFGQVRQAFMNILMNACDAMSRGGRLRVASRLVGGAVEVAVSDTGPGIPADRRSRIFDPFFTTKEKGTGLGLSVVYGIVERHGGTIGVESVEGAGTTFTIRLPVDAGAASDAPGAARASATG